MSGLKSLSIVILFVAALAALPAHAQDFDPGGLWSGTVTVKAVSEVQTGDTTPKDTDDPLTFKILIHVDEDGQARLLKEVTQMWKEATTIPCTASPDDDCKCPGDDYDYRCEGAPGYYVLITDDTRLSEFVGPTMRDGRSVGQRLSAPGYDYNPDPAVMFDDDSVYEEASRGMLMAGDIGYASSAAPLKVTLALGPGHPTNPFRHMYHPDHDNLNDLYEDFTDPSSYEVFEIERKLTLTFTEHDPDIEDPQQDDPLGWGDSLVGGEFAEELEGIHKWTIHMSGTFRLNRVSHLEELNP